MKLLINEKTRSANVTDHNCFGFRKHFFLWWWWWWWWLRHLTACSMVILHETPGILNPSWRDKNLGSIHHGTAYSHIQFNIYHQNGQIIHCDRQTFRPWYLCDHLLKTSIATTDAATTGLTAINYHLDFPSCLPFPQIINFQSPWYSFHSNSIYIQFPSSFFLLTGQV